MTEGTATISQFIEGTPARADSASRRQERERRRRATGLLRRAALGAAVLAAAGGGIAALRPRPLPVDLATVSRGPMIVTVDEAGRTRVKDRYLVSAPAAGLLGRLSLVPGDRVRAGEVVARIGGSHPAILDRRARAEAEARLAAASWAEGQAQAGAARARAATEHAQKEVVRMRALAQGGAATPVDLDGKEFEVRSRAEELAAAELGVRVAHEEMRRARVALDLAAGGRGPGGAELAIAAPVAGQVLRVLQQNEAVVQPGAPLLEIGDPGALEVVVDVVTADAVKVRPGARAVVAGWGGDADLAAHVQRVEPGAFTRLSALGVEEQRTNVILTLDDRSSLPAGLADGFRVDVRIVIWEATAVVAVPSSAVFRHHGGWAVYRLAEGAARLQPITPGHRNTETTEVREGVEPGAQVVLYPGDRLAEGRRIARR